MLKPSSDLLLRNYHYQFWIIWWLEVMIKILLMYWIDEQYS